ncbi:MAG: hypothetical protein Q9P44_14885 [Anaerolineae bacterium]|nr:hypothetical protein [Anaerolineae bacterium]
MNQDKKFLILRAGSMGRRRVRCLQAHGIAAENIRIFDRRENRRLKLAYRIHKES